MKTTKMLAILVLALGLMVCWANVSNAAPMGTAFTYQGRLMRKNKAVKGLYDFDFKLFDDQYTGTQLGSGINIYNLDVIKGYFTIELDFGDNPNIFNGDARWLEIDVRPGDSNDPNDFVTLSPRQEITPTPYALYAMTAGHIPGGVTGSGTANYIAKFTGPNAVGDSVIYESTGSIGIGTTNPGTNKLKVVGNIDATGFTEGGSNTLSNDISGNAATATNADKVDGYHYSLSWPTTLGNIRGACSNDFHNIGGTDDDVPDSDAEVPDYISINNGRLYAPSGSGNVGIGTTNPDEKLTVEGTIKVSTPEPTGYGIYSEATYSGNSTNYGGYFKAAGFHGKGVYGYATGGTGLGVFGYATGGTGLGVYGYATGSQGISVRGWGQQYDFYATGPGTNYGAVSSIRWKSDVRLIDEPLDKVMRLRGVYFNWDAEHGGEHDVGMIAEEVGEVLPEIVEYEAEGKYTSGMDYSKLTPLLVEAVKKLKGENDRLKERVEALERTIHQLAKVKELEL